MKKFFLSLLLGFVVSGVAMANTPSKNVLVVLTGVDYITGKDGKRHKTGYWLEEFSVPYKAMVETGIKVTVATPNGNRPVADPSSVATDKDGKPIYWSSKEEYFEALKIKAEVLDKGKIESLAVLNKKGLDGFDAIFFPGGHAPMEDLVVDANVGKALRYFHTENKPTALVCHGPIAILSTVDGDDFPYRGYKVTAFSNSEEKGSEVGQHLKVTPEDALNKAGAIFIKGDDWLSHVVEYRELITGQNPASSKAIAEALIRRLK